MKELSRNLRIVLLFMAIIAFSSASIAGARCSACDRADVEGWMKTATDFLAGTVTENNLSRPPASQMSVPDNPPSRKPVDDKSYENFSRILVPISDIDFSDILIDISPDPTEYIPGAISIPYTNFIKDDLQLKPASEMAKILGDAGISQNDSLLIYGECQPCGGGPSVSTYVYWITKYLGHENVKLLDGGLRDWVSANNPTTNKSRIMTPKSYTPKIKPGLLATYDYVKAGKAQILDARTPQEFASENIPGAINIPYDSVIAEGKIRKVNELANIFSGFRKDKPIIIYTNTGVKASMPWFALSLLGYDARLYSFQDWIDNQPKLEINLTEVDAEPNPAIIGDLVKITAIFGKTKQTEEIETNNESVLTIKGCATCGFGSPQGFADISQSNANGSGVVRIGLSAQPISNATAYQDPFKCSAYIFSPSGTQIGKAIMKRVSDDIFLGLWNANVASGNYSIDIVTSIAEASKVFPGVLVIDVRPPANLRTLDNIIGVM
jgi:thiosulfate/3-mercaptopyruvate sulfurtransferase